VQQAAHEHPDLKLLRQNQYSFNYSQLLAKRHHSPTFSKEW